VAVFSLRFALQDYRIERSAFDGYTSWSLLMPGRFVIGQDRVIRYAEFKPDYTTAPSPPTRCPPRAGRPLTLHRRKGGQDQSDAAVSRPGNGIMEEAYASTRAV
jgi:hypothetical protein